MESITIKGGKNSKNSKNNKNSKNSLLGDAGSWLELTSVSAKGYAFGFTDSAIVLSQSDHDPGMEKVYFLFSYNYLI